MFSSDKSIRQHESGRHVFSWVAAGFQCALVIALLAVGIQGQQQPQQPLKEKIRRPLARLRSALKDEKRGELFERDNTRQNNATEFEQNRLPVGPQATDQPTDQNVRQPFPAKAPEQADQPEPTIVLRVAWGGGAPQAWEGLFEIDRGQLGTLRALGLEADEPCGFAIRGRTAFIQQPSPRTYDGFDVPIHAPLDTRVVQHLTLTGDGASQLIEQHVATPQVDLPLRYFVSDRKTIPIDLGKNRLTVRRAPGDKLRVKTDRDYLVFKPGETFEFAVKPHLSGLAGGSTAQLEVKLVGARGGQLYDEDSTSFVTDRQGGLTSYKKFAFKVPEQEGAYDIPICLAEETLTGSILGHKPVARRIIQFVVVAPNPQQQTNGPIGPPRTIDELTPAREKSWWDRLTRLPELKDIPGFGKGVLSHGKVGITKRGHRQFVQLAPGAWQAFPISISDTHRPHILEVEYPEDRPQTLGISIIEPDKHGSVSPLGVSSGVHVRPMPDVVAGGVARQRIIFWPGTKNPLVLLTNRGGKENACFGTVRVLQGGSMLTAFDRRPRVEGCRKAMAYFDKPVFAENFAATPCFDRSGGRGLDDWQTFHQGAARLLRYLEYVGFDGAVIPATCEGAALYPSRVLAATPKYDTGVFFSSGQDPMPKDVMEMLFRMFTAQGKTLTPSFQFASPLLELEEARLADPQKAIGITLVDSFGRTFKQVHGRQRGLGPCYNPLDARVQAAILRVIEEFARRYSHHPSFGDISLRLSSESYLLLPGTAWGCDSRTVARFEKSTAQQVPPAGPRDAWLNGPGRDVWLKWRSEQLAEFHQRIHRQLATIDPEARIYMAPADAFQGRQASQHFQPRLKTTTKIESSFKELGLDLSLYRKNAGIQWLRPRYTTPIVSLLRQGSALECNESPQVDKIFHAAGSGSLFVNEPQPVVAPEFGQASIFGKQQKDVFVMSHFSENGANNRRRFIHALATIDSSVFFEGGWMLPLGQEESLRPILDIYRRLPAKPFKQFAPREAVGENALSLPQSIPPVVVRTLSYRGRTYVYLVNDSPWPVIAKVTFQSPQRGYVESLDRSRETFQMEKDHEGVHWRVSLGPYGLTAGTLPSPNAKIVRFSADLPPAAIATLQEKIRVTQLRAIGLKRPAPWNVLSNPDFEVQDDKNQSTISVPGWIFSNAKNVNVTTDGQGAYHGKNSLRIESTGPIAWLRSEPFASPGTGRIAVRAWIRSDGHSDQSPLRIAIEGRIDGKSYYRFATIGASPKTPIEKRWTPYVFQIDDLPPGGLSDLRVGFDMCGKGRVWVDDVQVFDLAFSPTELGELSKMLALADYHLRRGKVGECLRIMSGYWPRYIDSYVPMPELHVAERDQYAPAPAKDDSADSTKPDDNAPRSATLYERLKGYIPGSSWF